jgi:hypothetical protein
VVLVFALLRWLPYRRWKEKLPFVLQGNFDDLATDRSDSDTWQSCAVKLEFVMEDPTGRKAANAALRIFCVSANKCIYNTRWGKISRWSAQGLEAFGDANISVAWKIYGFISRDLVDMHKSGVEIDRVTVIASGNTHSVPAESDTMS